MIGWILEEGLVLMLLVETVFVFGLDIFDL